MTHTLHQNKLTESHLAQKQIIRRWNYAHLWKFVALGEVISNTVGEICLWSPYMVAGLKVCFSHPKSMMANINTTMTGTCHTKQNTGYKISRQWSVKGSPLRSSEFHTEILSSVDWQYRNTQRIPSIWIFTRTFAADLINYGYMAQNINQHLKVTEYLQLCGLSSFWKYTITYYIMSWRFLYTRFHNTHTFLYEVIKARLKRPVYI
jgi:hypothetical protein